MQRGLSASPQTWLPFFQKMCKLFPAATDPLRVPVPNFAFDVDKIFSIYLHLADGCESMRISAPIWRQGPQIWKNLQAWCKTVCIIFSVFFGLCTPFQKNYGHAKFWVGHYPLPEIWQKRGLLQSVYFEHSMLQRAAALERHPAVDLIWSLNRTRHLAYQISAMHMHARML